MVWPTIGKDWRNLRFHRQPSQRVQRSCAKTETIGGKAHPMGRRCYMAKLAIWAEVQAKAGKEKEVEAFLKSAQPLAEREGGTLTWYAVQTGPGKYGIFDTFADESGREAHLTGEIAKALIPKANELFAKPPEIHKIDVLAGKGPV